MCRSVQELFQASDLTVTELLQRHARREHNTILENLVVRIRYYIIVFTSDNVRVLIEAKQQIGEHTLIGLQYVPI
jgi:hypothetical protein